MSNADNRAVAIDRAEQRARELFEIAAGLDAAFGDEDDPMCWLVEPPDLDGSESAT